MSYDLEYGEFRNKPLAYLRDHEPDYSDAEYMIKRWPKAFTMVPYTYHSRSYDSGGPTNESNYRVWKDDFAETEGKTWWDLGSSGIFVRIDIAPTDQKEAIDALEEYPILSESDESDLTQEIQDENWNDYGLRDTRDELAGRADPELRETVEALFEKMPERIFANAYWEQISTEGSGPEQDGGGYGTVFPRAFEDWDGESFSALLAWLGLEEAVVRVNLSDAAFTSWTPTTRGEKERKLRITKEQLKESLGEMKVSSAQLARLMRDQEIIVPLTEEFPCESLYVSCSYPWETENEQEQADERRHA